jgi:hypothetical protein
MKYDRGWDVWGIYTAQVQAGIDLPMKMELIEGSETSPISTQTPGKHPKETY